MASDVMPVPIRISILAPARGATCRRVIRPEAAPFQFSPLREGRPLVDVTNNNGVLFQFSPLREGRPAVPAGLHGWKAISILAPARGATHGTAIHPCAANFNSRPCERGDYPMCRTYILDRFQFSPLREGRQQK